ncbi:hypothetical protein [Mesorhizobium sp. M4B.F.Ca.ET.049.02.1.2]|uniref:hypothetical protein n=1 Tax=Mesorhizobium sp. M4B.F.Ca.ET.049.02.1.2 TaxID=2496752 RepID=UPI000FC9B2FC|nr:hypothetical protein [Mesorhizobium sp. M4B.F.Ca.ET.049.02.1.2]RUW76611.1 hypothetical protein EOA31_06475 [Mesorhizobium sp. M4B.F.Ca.ET.049.02.1.2]
MLEWFTQSNPRILGNVFPAWGAAVERVVGTRRAEAPPWEAEIKPDPVLWKCTEAIYSRLTYHSDGSVFLAGDLDAPGSLMYRAAHVHERPFFRTHMTLAIR